MHNSDYLTIFLAILVAAMFVLKLGSSLSLGPRRAIVALASVVAYYNLDAAGLPLCLVLIALNWGVGLALTGSSERTQQALVTAGVIVNIGFLAAYKYQISLLTNLFPRHPVELGIGLPLGLSFIVFRLVSYLVDLRAGGTVARSPLDLVYYALFFPAVLCGPLIRYDAIASQDRLGRTSAMDWSAGLALIGIGLAKNILISPVIAEVADKVFAPLQAAQPVPLATAWIGMIAYGLQIYFDFSGYSDAAVGVARLIGVQLPANFHSPFKARSMVDFWQRWHVSLTRFLTIYVYNVVTLEIARKLGTKASALRQFAGRIALPTMLVMVLMGIWHGNHANFALFGLYHGTALVVNHAWRTFGGRYRRATLSTNWWPAIASTLTFATVAGGWAIFRAANPSVAGHSLASLFGVAGAAGPVLLASGLPTQFGDAVLATGGATPVTAYDLGILVALAVIVSLAPNSNQILSRLSPVFEGGGFPRVAASVETLKLSLSPVWAFGVSCLIVSSAVVYLGNDHAALLYFHF